MLPSRDIVGKTDTRPERTAMDEQTALELRRRRGFLLDGTLASAWLTLMGIVAAVIDGMTLWYVFAAMFGLATILWAIQWLAPSELLLERPGSHFRFFPPSDLIPQYQSAASRPESRRFPKSDLFPSGTWDRDLDGAPRAMR